MTSFTQSQESALQAGGNVLVVAGAGTGKTRTLVERCVLELRAGCSWNEILMVTFTEAAAAEMRERIRQRLQKSIASGHPNTAPAQDGIVPPGILPPGVTLAATNAPTHLEEQLALLDAAQISTLHSFCLKLVREHFHHPRLELDPQFTVLSEDQLHQLRHQTLDALLEQWYGGDSESAAFFQDWVARQANGSDARVRDWIWRLHSHVQSLPDPRGWFDHQLALFNQPEPVQWRNWLEDGFEAWRTEWLPALEQQPPSNVPAAICAKALKDCLASTPPRHPIPPFASALTQVVAADSDNHWPRGKKTILRSPLKRFFEEAKFLQCLADAENGQDPLAQDWAWTRRGALVLLEIARVFGEAFGRAKREAGGVDFADLEQFALRLLWDEAAGRPTPIAMAWRARLKRVFVDEYQDINAAQDRILRALSRDDNTAQNAPGGNRFLVGDIKQSIYRFRSANPAIFQHYRKCWKEDPALGHVVPLSDNFRSSEALLNFINPLFSMLMCEFVGGVDYDSDALLKFGAPRDRAALGLNQNPGPKVELHLRVKGGEEDSNSEDDLAPGIGQELADLESIEKEARLVALRLRELHNQKHPVWDESNQRFRDVQWRDMVVLMRSPANKVEAFAKQFSRVGVPLHAARTGFFDTTEIGDLLALLQLLDNPLQDIPALAVLRSPLASLSLDELVAVRAAAKPEDSFWVALQKLIRTRRETPSATAALAESARLKVQSFIKSFENWRAQVRQGALADTLERILADTHYEALLLAQSRGEERVVNVRRLVNLARRFDPHMRQGLFRFLQFVEAQREAETAERPAPPGAVNAVRLLSIHQSKGLEFPIVVAADLGKPFNLGDLSADFLLDDAYGLCPRVSPPASKGQYPSLVYWLARRRQRRDFLGEELRLLYVALTRAKDSLILTATTANNAAVEEWREQSNEDSIRPERILAARSSWDWLQLSLIRLCRPEQWSSQAVGLNSVLKWNLYSENDSRLADQAKGPDAAPEAEVRPPAEALPASLVERLTWTYPHLAAAAEPAKTSVTVQRRHLLEGDPAEESVCLFSASFNRIIARQEPTQALSAAERGIAHHKFLQFVKLDCDFGGDGLRQEARRLVRERILSPQESDVLDIEALAAFWRSDLGRRVAAHAPVVRRELPFTARFSPQTLGNLIHAGRSKQPLESDLQNEFVVLQGVADLVVPLQEEIWLLDFKTDTFPERDLPAKAASYELQLRVYSHALQCIYHRPVTECYLHFLGLRKSVRV